MPWGDLELEVEFDFVDQRLWLRRSDGRDRSLTLRAGPIADFYAEYMAALESAGLRPNFSPVPNEIPDAVPFAEDHQRRAYDPAWAAAFFRALLSAQRVMAEFRSDFVGKVSPIHFFWGGFDLAVTRFSGRLAPRHPGGIPNLPDHVTVEAYSHEVSSAGFWPGNDLYTHPAFYSYAYPEPPGFSEAHVGSGAFYHPTLREFLLPYELLHHSSSPSNRLLEFFQDTYRAAAELGNWDRASLERPLPRERGPEREHERAPIQP
jgi:hypothetical protein